VLFVCPPKFCVSIVFFFLLGPLKVSRETGDNAYAEFGGSRQKECSGIFRSGLLTIP